MKSLFAIIAIISLASCSGGGKKVLVMASGKVQVNGNTITLEPGTGHNESSFVPEGDSITVVSPSGTTGFPVKEAGLYLLNLKKDTIVGAYQLVGTDNSQIKLTQENLKARIDSLYQLMIAYNVDEGKKQFNLPPFTIKKITANTDAEIVGPFRKLPASFNPAIDHEVYKFSTNKEIWDLILKLHKMTIPDQPPAK